MSAGSVREITDVEFDEAVLQRPGPVLVDVWGDGCASCRMLALVLDDLAPDAPGLEIVKINLTHNPATAERTGVMSVPTMLLYVDGKPVKTIVGAKPKSWLMTELQDYIR